MEIFTKTEQIPFSGPRHLTFFVNCRKRIDNKTTKSVFFMASEDTEWLKKNFGQEPDIAFPGDISNLPGYYNYIHDTFILVGSAEIIMMCQNNSATCNFVNCLHN